jgi:uncharacterized membrane protein SpoIIM required for sporulation
MDYATFIRRGAPRWDETDRLLAAPGGVSALGFDGLTRLSALHRSVVTDYAFARAHFAGTEAERRLARLALAGHSVLAQRRAPILEQIAGFYRHEYRQLFLATAPALRVSLVVFVGAGALGGVLTWLEPDFAVLLIGVDQVEQVKAGEIWTDAIGVAAPPSVLSSYIFTNNIGVAFTAWAGGALLGLGTLVILITNGLMVGSLVVLCARYGMLDRLFAFISAHGPLELFLICLASAAGLRMGGALVSWDHRPRVEAFAEVARASFRMMLATVPWFVLLGIVEGYISPVMTLGTPLKGVIGIGLLAVFLALATAPSPTKNLEAT